MDKFHKILNSEFVSVPGCWETCDSACCKQDFEILPFAFIPKGASMIFTGREYEWLKENNLLQEGFEKFAHRHEFRLENGKSLTFYTSLCKLEGKCSIPNHRPLTCKLFPWFPRIDIKEKKITGFTGGTVFEQFWKHLKVKSPCTLVNENDQNLIASLHETYRPLLDEPHFLFYIKSAEIALDAIDRSIGEALSKNSDKDTLIQNWEREYLQGKNINWNEIRGELTKLHDQISELHPGEDFL